MTRDDKYIISGSADKTISVWDISNKILLHSFEKAHSDWINSVALTSDDKHIISGSHDRTIGVWNLTSLSTNFRPKAQHCLQKLQTDQSPSLNPNFAELYHFPQNWNLLNYVMFYLPTSAYQEYIDFAIEHKMYLSYDIYGSTQLDYLLLYHKQISKTDRKTDEFTAYFFKKLPKLIDLNSWVRHRITKNIYNSLNWMFLKKSFYAGFINLIKHFILNIKSSIGILWYIYIH